MNKLFSLDSPLMRKLSHLPDLILLNLLWMLCAAPIITAGAATVALHAVLQKYVAGEENGVIRPFFEAFRSNFKQSTRLWIPLVLVMGLLLLDLLFLMEKALGAQLLLWIPFLLIGTIVAVLASYAFPLMARYENDTKAIISNSFLLFSLHFVPSLAVILLNGLPWLLLVLLPDVFVQTVALWLVAGFSLMAYIAEHILLPIFKKYDPQQEE